MSLCNLVRKSESYLCSIDNLHSLTHKKVVHTLVPRFLINHRIDCKLTLSTKHDEIFIITLRVNEIDSKKKCKFSIVDEDGSERHPLDTLVHVSEYATEYCALVGSEVGDRGRLKLRIHITNI